MFKLIKALSVFAALVFSIGRAAALPFDATATSEQYTFTNNSLFVVTLLNVELFTGPSNTPVTEPTFASVNLNTGESFTEFLTGLTVGASYNTLPGVLSSSTPTKYTETVGSVPLPAGFPLFAMALLALVSLGYFGARSKKVKESELAKV